MARESRKRDAASRSAVQLWRANVHEGNLRAGDYGPVRIDGYVRIERESNRQRANVLFANAERQSIPDALRKSCGSARCDSAAVSMRLEFHCEESQLRCHCRRVHRSDRITELMAIQ